MPRNPDWTRDELILALDLYLRAGNKQLPAKDPQVIELSALLNQLPIHQGIEKGEEFRNSNGVSMKLGNFMRVDPAYEGIGLRRGNHLEQVVWNDFASDPYRLQQTVSAIRRSARADRVAEPKPRYGTADEEEFPEGRLLTRQHKTRERDPNAVRRKKEDVLQSTGALQCEACEFDFEVFYGALGKAFAECHHRVPLSALREEAATRLKDLAIVCANCHRMLHRSKPMLTVEGLRERLQAWHAGQRTNEASPPPESLHPAGADAGKEVALDSV